MNIRSVKHEQGAVTLIGVIFLIVSVAALLAAVQRMGASSITDSALHSDGVQALFIAESGLEIATWLYSSGNTCAALSGKTENIGPGSFSILTASMAGSECRVRVIGQVRTSSSANAVSRIVEGELSASATAGGWAVGKKDRGELILNFNGSNWSKAGSVAGKLNKDLLGISCVSANDCWAVGDRDKGGTIIHWDGSNWSIAGPYSSIPNEDLTSVYCLSSSDCWAVGKDGGGELIIRWDGISWRRAGPYAGIPNEELASVHCVSSSDCWAVGKDRDGELIIRWDGTSWSRMGPYNSIPDKNLYSVHCVSSNDCWAVGEDSGGELIIHWDGTTWSRAGPYAGIGNKKLYSVHCTSSIDCWAVGERDGYENIIRWNGATWARFGNIPDITGSKHLYGVHMISGAEGYIVGQDGTMAVWDGTTWTGQPGLTGKDLLAVTSYNGMDGVAEVVRWREVVQ